MIILKVNTNFIEKYEFFSIAFLLLKNNIFEK